MAFVFRPVCSLASNEFHRDSMLGMDRESNGWRAYALELWAESRERVADELCAGAECFARLGFVGEAEKDRYVAGRLRNRAGTDRVEAAELWRRSEVTSYASKEVLLSPQCAGRSAIRTASPIGPCPQAVRTSLLAGRSSVPVFLWPLA